MSNFVQTSNPFGLATPPAWFLAALAAYDSSLVIFPSTSNPVYRMARRTTTGRAQLNRVLKCYPDSEVYFQHRLWAWKSVEPMGIGKQGMTWHKLLLEIPEFDQQRFASADAAADALDGMDVEQERATDRRLQGELDARNHDAYVLAGALAGSRTRAPRAVGSRRPAYRPPDFGGGAAIFTGR